MTGLGAPLRDAYIIGLLLARGARLLAVDATSAADEVRRRHHLVGDATRVAAEGVVAAQLMSAYIKGEERITLQVHGEEPQFSFLADVCANGAIRARFTPGQIPPSRTLSGFLGVIKHDHERELYRGMARIPDTDFQGALQDYIVRSQQSVAVVRLGAHLGPSGEVELALGLLVEKLPDMERDLFMEIFGALEGEGLVSLGAMLGQHSVMGIPVEVLETRAVKFGCWCSMERVHNILRALGPAEVRSLLQEQGRAEVSCHFCCEQYEVPGVVLEDLLREMEEATDPS